MNRIFALASLLVSAAVIGCGPTTQEIHVAVKNDSYEPMTVVLTKDGPPMEMKWLPPEDFAAMHKPPAEAQVNGIVINPGQSVDQKRVGQFSSGTQAMLRVYRGPQTLESMLGIGPDSPNRTDIPLAAGTNLIVIDKSGKATRQ
ncbi:MAG: hypothetical protein QM754_21385 [Tepidisphaeraceae bacterium]